MNKKYQINNLSEWLALPEIEIPTINNPHEKGKVYDVKNVGFFMAAIEECSTLNIIKKSNLKGKIPLPTIVIKFESYFKQFRLPVELNGWACDCVALVAGRENLFPCKVGIGNLNGKIYAELL